MKAQVQITESAAKQISKLIKKEGADANGVRVSVQGGGCSGLSYKLDLESEEREGDRVYEAKEEIKLYVDKKSFLFLVGTILDWSDGLNGKGFEFTNPNATSTCGCGSSFAA
jgi:iron-sulfur cluster assembly protein|tara:strand:+ start:37949 stop:38284 length:336 start_codon:yes stop_codon:yes gene_type:complete